MNRRQFLHAMPVTLNVQAGLIAGFIATVVLSIVMIAKSSVGLLPQLNPIEDIVHVVGRLTGMTLPLPFGVDWPLRPRNSRVGHHLRGVTGKPSRHPGRQGPCFRSSSLARADDLLHAPGREWLIRAVAGTSGDGGDARSSPHLRCGFGCRLRQIRPRIASA